MREFSAQELKTYLDQADTSPLLIDVRQPWEYDVCKLENSNLIPMS
ncbi:MAG TPA: sulfurtransferase, partial [Thiotrichales bacterium]|nr:sulfurtransferase [Thiotrichales bacterium]